MTSTGVLVAIAGQGLHPSLRRIMESPLEPGAWRALAGQIGECRLAAFALEASKAGALPVTEEQEAELRRRSDEAERQRRSASECVDEIVAELDRHSINSCVLHEAALSSLDYPPSLRRPFESVDVLVLPQCHDGAVELLKGAGLLRADRPEQRSRRHRGSHRYVTARGIGLGVHSSLIPRRPRTGAVDARDLFASTIPYSPQATELRALGAEERLIAACLHVLDRPAGDLLVRRDVVQLVLRDDLSTTKVERLAATWRVEAVLAAVVHRAWDTFDVPDVVPLSAWSRAYRPHRRDRRRLGARALSFRLPRAEADGGAAGLEGRPLWESGS